MHSLARAFFFFEQWFPLDNSTHEDRQVGWCGAVARAALSARGRRSVLLVRGIVADSEQTVPELHAPRTARPTSARRRIPRRCFGVNGAPVFSTLTTNSGEFPAQRVRQSRAF